jgi:adenosylhomocysteine nucleosidase
MMQLPLTARSFVLAAALSLYVSGSVSAKEIPIPATPAAPCVVVMASFPEELDSIEKMLVPDGKFETTTINGIRFHSAEIRGRKHLFFLTGMSLVNAASSTQLVLDRFNVQAVFFTGIAGGVNPEFHPGDVIIPARWHYHGEAAYFNEIAPGKFQMPGEWFKQRYPNFGMIFPDEVQVIREGMDKHERVASFPADEQLLAAAKAATAQMEPMKAAGGAAKVSYGGAGVSGTVFCDNAEYRKWVYSTWKADCLDMESAAIAQVCWANKVPCLIVRGLSDLAGGQAGQNQMEEYLHAAADNSAAVLVKILQNYEPAVVAPAVVKP